VVRGLAAITLAWAPLLYGADTRSVDSRVCAGCHRQIYESYSRTGMGRSFGRVDDRVWRDGEYFHAKSEQQFTMYRREGRY
jgi:hypothetical protein